MPKAKHEFVAPDAVRSYVAQDAAQRLATVEQVATLSWRDGWARSPGANGTILMMDDRKADSATVNGSVVRAPYYKKTFVLNYLYAMRHQLEFLLVRPTSGMWLDNDRLCPAWCRVKILANIVAARIPRDSSTHRAARRHWVLYIDSDAYVREQHTDMLAKLTGDPRNADIHVAIAREEPPAAGFRSPRRRPHGVRTPSLNAGVLFVRSSPWSARFLAAWMQAPQLPVCAPFRQSWPCEQQCFHELLRNRTLLPSGWRRRVATAPTQLFNSPWGTFIRHVWGGPGVELRKRVFDDELRSQGVWRKPYFESLLEGAQSTWRDQSC